MYSKKYLKPSIVLLPLQIVGPNIGSLNDAEKQGDDYQDGMVWTMIPKVGNGPILKQVVGSIYDAVVGSGGDHYVQTVKIIIYFSITKP